MPEVIATNHDIIGKEGTRSSVSISELAKKPQSVVSRLGLDCGGCETLGELIMSDTPASLLQSRVVEMGGKNGEADARFSEPHLSQPIGGEVRGQAGPSEVLRSGSEHRMESDCGVNHPTVYQQGVSIISEPDLMGSFKESTIQALGSETAKDNTFSTPVGHGTTPSWSDSVEEEHNRFRDLPNSLDVARNRGEDRQLGDQGAVNLNLDFEVPLVEHQYNPNPNLHGRRGRGGGPFRGVRGGRGGAGNSRAMDEGRPQRTWANVAASSRSDVKLRYIPPSTIDDAVLVHLPPRPEPLDKWDSCLVGYFVDKGVGYNYLRNSAFRLWKSKGLKEVQTNGDGFIFFIFHSPESCREVFEGGPWYIGGFLIILKQWKRMMKLAIEKFTKIPIWVKFFNVPMEYWDPDGISRIASAIGNPLFMDQLTARGGRLAFVRVCIEIEATSKLPTYFQIRCEEDVDLIRVEYQGIPAICQHCQIFGHETNKCVSTQVAHLISLQKNTEAQLVTEQEEEWTTVNAKGKRKVGEPDPVLSPVIEEGSVPITVEEELVPQNEEASQPNPAVVSNLQGRERNIAQEAQANEMDEFTANVLEITKLVIPNAADHMEATIAEVRLAKEKPQAATHQAAHQMSSKSSGKGNSNQRKKKK